MHGRGLHAVGMTSDARSKKRLICIADFSAAPAFFLLDSFHPPSLTLRDYSKVVGEDKLSISSKNQLSAPV
jgi:hypothetical protein